MRKYEKRDVLISRDVEIRYECDGCGIPAKDTEFGSLTEVAIEVNYGEEFGTRDTYDYCEDCLLERAAIFLAAGSRSEIVGGEGPLPDDETLDD
jgi:hypothetical protein